MSHVAADDWRIRDEAQSQILAVGPPAMAVLKQIKPTAPAEAAQRIDLILQRLSEELESANNPGNSSNPTEGSDVAPIFLR